MGINKLNYKDEYITLLRTTFIEEARDLLERADHLYSELKEKEAPQAPLQEVFQIYHTLKGSAGASGFDDLQQFVHKVESLIVHITGDDEQIKVEIKVIDLLLRCNDKISDYLDQLQHHDSEKIDATELTNAIESAISSEPPNQPYGVFELPAPRPQLNEKQQENDFKSQGESKQIKAKQTPPTPPPNKTKINNEEFIKMPLSKIQNLIDQFGELVILQSILEQHKNNLQEDPVLVANTITSLAKITRETQKISMSLRMFPVKPLFVRLAKIARDTCSELNKEVRIVTEGDHVEIEKSVYDALAPAVGHIIRNAIDHGIESKQVRIENKKPPEALIKISAKQESGSFVLKISDDGKGFDIDKILKKAIESRLVSETTKLTEHQILQLVFENGLSTSEKITNISGRGVGMGAVKDTISGLKGSCQLDSKKGTGSEVTIKVPLNLSVFNGTVIRIGHERYILPNSDYIETVKLSRQEITHSNKVVIKGDTFTVSHLREHLPTPIEARSYDDSSSSGDDDKITAVVVSKNGNNNKAFIVDELISQERIVLKKLGAEVSAINMFSGATIMSDGSVTLILNVNNMAA